MDKGKKEIEKKANMLKELRIEYVPVESIHPNEYNPNRQSEHDFELLQRSMKEDGFTQPIIVQKNPDGSSSGIIVDGEHRWKAAKAIGYKEIPVVFVDMTVEQMRISTLRHNRARGTEDINLTANVLRDLQELGALDWAQDSLMLTDVEINRLLEDVPVSEALASEEFGGAWIPVADTGGEKERAIGNIRVSQTEGANAKTEEERQMAVRDRENSIYSLNCIFSGEEAPIVRKVVGSHPAETILKWARAAVEKDDNGG